MKDASTSTLSLTMDRALLASELAALVPCAEKKTTTPILGNVLLRSGGESLEMIATDLEIALRTTVAAQVKEPGAITIPAKRLHDYVRALPDGPITITGGSNDWVNLKCGQSRTRMPGMAVDSYPTLPDMPDPLVAFRAADLKRLIRRTTYAISQEESRFTLNGAKLDLQPGIVRMVATDGHRLALCEAADAGVDFTHSALWPMRLLAQVSRHLDSLPGDELIRYADNQDHLWFSFGSRLLQARRLTGNFPDYTRVLPKDMPHSCEANRQTLRDAVSRVRNFADERSRAIRLSIGDAGITITGQTAEAGECTEVVECAKSTGSLEVGLNAAYVQQALEAMTEHDTVRLIWRDPQTAFRIQPAAAEGDSDFCVVMPMRLS